MATGLHTTEHARLVALLQQMRTEADLTQEALAKRLRRPQSFVSKVEAGERRIDLIELEAIAKALGSTLSEVVGRYEATAPRSQRRRRTT